MAISLQTSIFTKTETILFGLFYCLVFSLSIFKLAPELSIFLITGLYLITVLNNFQNIMLYPFMLYPFMFIIKGIEDTNMLLALVPDVMVFFSICFYLFTILRGKKISRRLLKFSILIIFHAFLTVIVCLYNINDISFLLVLIRQYMMPLLFLLIVIRNSIHDISFPKKALMISIISFASIALLAILNAAQLINFESSMEELNPFLMGLKDDQLVAFERNSFLFGSLPRLNLLTGGALGSSGSVFVALTFISFSRQLFADNLIFARLCGLGLLTSAIFSGSTSVLTPVVVYLYILFLKLRSSVMKNVIFIFIVPIIIWIIFFSSAFLDKSPFEYFYSTIGISIIEYFDNLDLNSFLFGVGPRITSVGYVFMPSNFIIDAGMMRVFIETGIINFVLFASIIIYIFYRGYTKISHLNLKINNAFFLLFVTFCLLVHANFLFLPPFYPLFSASVAGILTKN